MAPLKWLFRIVGGTTPKSDEPTYWDGDIPWATPADLSGCGPLGLTQTQRQITGAGLVSCGTNLVPAGSIVLSTRAPIGSLAVARVPLCTNQGCRCLVPKGQTQSDYFAQLLTSCTEALNIRGKGTTFLELSGDELARFKVPVPPEPEQRLIAQFLRYETAKIDALIAQQRRLIELLNEKRQAVISNAVTKGLNPDAPMKPSGVEWLGDVPAHWKVAKCGRYVSILPGFAFPSSQFSADGEDVRLLRGVNVGVSEIRWDDVAYWKRSAHDGLDPFLLQQGDIVLGMDRPIINGGIRVARIAANDLPCLLLQRVARLRPSPLLKPEYLTALLSSTFFEAHITPETTGVSVPHISAEQIASFVIPLPPLHEQEGIAAVLASSEQTTRSLSCESERAIELLHERRTALISAAVTGLIDVRGLVAAEVA